MPDSLTLSMDRKMVLLWGNPGSGKSYSVAQLLSQLKDQNKSMVMLDADRGITEAIREVMGKVPDNLSYFRATNWANLRKGRDYALNLLGPGDWLVIENAARIWRLARRSYIETAYGMDEDEFLEMKRREAEERVVEELAKVTNAGLSEEEKSRAARKVRNQVLQYEGLDGRTDWPRITTKYFQALGPVFDEGEFNILTTTTAYKLDSQTIEKYPEYVALGLRPEGQSDLVSMHSTIAHTYVQDGKYLWRTDIGDASKDRGHARKAHIPFNDIGFWQSYTDQFPEEA